MLNSSELGLDNANIQNQPKQAKVTQQVYKHLYLRPSNGIHNYKATQKPPKTIWKLNITPTQK